MWRRGITTAIKELSKSFRTLIRCGWSLWAHVGWTVRNERPIALAMARAVPMGDCTGQFAQSALDHSMACGTGGMPGGRVFSRSKPNAFADEALLPAHTIG
jgi:hypothetical protein